MQSDNILQCIVNINVNSVFIAHFKMNSETFFRVSLMEMKLKAFTGSIRTLVCPLQPMQLFPLVVI